jgi:putative ABC transport system substrate-binding protein
MWCSALRCIITLILSLLIAPLVAEAQPSPQVPRIGVLLPGSALTAPAFLEPFVQGLRDLGYVEGQNIAFEYRYAEGRGERLPDLAAELARLKVDVILAQGLAAARAAQHATSIIPVVMTGGGVDPVAEGLVVSLAHPGGNITGVSAIYGALVGKRVELLKEMVPHLSRMAVLMNPDHPAHAGLLRETQRVAHALGLGLHVLEIRRRDELETAFAGIRGREVDALFVFQDPLLSAYHRDIAALALQHRLVTIFPWRTFVEAGGLMSYGPNVPDQSRRAAHYVDKILKGAKPADLPVEQPMKFELVINLKTAKALGITIPPVVLFQADEIIR